MKFAFFTQIAPPGGFEILAQRARELGFDGVELGAIPDDVAAVRAAFIGAGVEVACLASGVSIPRKHKDRGGAAAELLRWIEAAQRLGCGRVKVDGFLAPRGQTGPSAAAEFAQWILPLADEAGGRGVMLVVENDLSFIRAKELWMLLESVNHASVAGCWDLYNASRVGERPFISVPTLNSRIGYARVRDVDSLAGPTSYCKLGEGQLAVENFLTRLRGIGYGGYVTVETAQGLLGDAIEKLRGWTKPAETGHGKKGVEVRKAV